MIADTSFMIDLMRNDPSAVKKVQEIEQSGLTIVLGAPSVFELYVGVSLSKKAIEEESLVTETLASLPILPLDSQSAIAAGIIYGERIKAGQKIDPEDAMIAGIAKTGHETILTRNLKHFSGIRGVGIERY